ncbi:hypothetical protein T484DRAFT_1831014 [Baffinella frigidus]|nr:hypothetical protein T484DRAFT_1831014 [Cryptophyta sp. CCMP2293]
MRGHKLSPPVLSPPGTAPPRQATPPSDPSEAAPSPDHPPTVPRFRPEDDHTGLDAAALLSPGGSPSVRARNGSPSRKRSGSADARSPGLPEAGRERSASASDLPALAEAEGMTSTGENGLGETGDADLAHSDAGGGGATASGGAAGHNKTGAERGKHVRGRSWGGGNRLLEEMSGGSTFMHNAGSWGWGWAVPAAAWQEGEAGRACLPGGEERAERAPEETPVSVDVIESRLVSLGGVSGAASHLFQKGADALRRDNRHAEYRMQNRMQMKDLHAEYRMQMFQKG